MDLTDSIAPRSDQQNFDDYVTGPRTVTISEVKAGTAEQPVEIHLVEFPGRPLKPSKTVRRILVAAWGAEASAYAGRRMTLYGDPTVKFGGAVVGGIRVSHLSDIDKAMTVNLTTTRGKRAPFVVKPLAHTPKEAAQVAPDTSHLDRVLAAFDAAGVEQSMRLEFCARRLERAINSPADITPADATKIITALRADAEGGE